MKNIILIIAILIVVGIWYYAFYNADKEMQDISEEDVSRIVSEVENGSAVLIDVRTTEELAETGYAEGAIHFDLARLQAGEVPDVASDQTVYIYCKSGGRAGEAKRILETNGFIDVTNIGGLADWVSIGGPVSQ